MLPLTLPRRHRRRLLLPPGLPALAWLLWLGCVAVPQVRGVRPQHVMEVNFPPLHKNLWSYSVDASLQEIAAFRPWQTLAVTGNLFEDYFALRNAQAVFRHLEADPNHNRGLQVRIGQHASYSSLIQLLDWCNVYNMKQYWIDIQHEPYALYVFTSKPEQTDKKFPDLYNLVMCDSIVEYGSEHNPTSWLGSELVQLWTHDWRNSVLLLLLIGAASAYRLGRGWWAR
ncbi:hypothetical protein D0N36_06685 [Hymenobacter lapidiphilus]|uniref:hypothetical protein n=1 Tax=Hymenobacter sp. CCM 8763 TaxID=2303334 RepID=UPI000E34669A|nr:hypothetical protein [Hymenobacter sp. CCM 8763]RFP65884.1 hypothetical protein D0N36_06685 [Hymenobacter sp. CCM 8763]